MQRKPYPLAIAIAAVFASIASAPVLIAQTQTETQADVTVKQGEAQVEIERAEPVVKLKQAEPKVEVQQGEAELKVEQGQPQLTTTPTDDGQTQTQTGIAATEQPAGETIDPHNPIYQLRVGDFDDRDVINNNGEEIGEIDGLVVDPKAKRLLAVLEVGGFLGLGERKIAVELQDLQIRDGILVLNTMDSEDELKQRPEFDEDNYVEIDDFDATLGEFGEADFARFEEKLSQ